MAMLFGKTYLADRALRKCAIPKLPVVILGEVRGRAEI